MSIRYPSCNLIYGILIMTFAQYLRIETSLGGIACTAKQFIKACLDYMLAYLWKAQDLAFDGLLKDIDRVNDLSPCEGELDLAWQIHELNSLIGD